MIQTLEDLTDTFQSSCDKYGKLFVPDANSEAVGNSLLRFYSRNYSLELLEKVVNEYIRTFPSETIQIYEFAISNAKYRERVIERDESNKEIQRLMQETRERMQVYQDELRDITD